MPEWQGSVTVHPLERASIETCGTGALTDDGRKRITRSPYLQSTTHNSTIVVWGSKNARAEVATLREPGSEVLQTIPAIYAGHGRRDHGEVRVVHSAFHALEPGHLYCYQLLADGVALTEPAPLATAPGQGLTDPLTFVVTGDSGTGGAAAKAIAQRMTEVSFDLMLFLGDIAYERGTPAELQTHFFDVYAHVLRYVPAFPAIGNHERHTENGRPYLEAFVLPEPERYYSFDWGDVHFVAIDTTRPDAEQLAWLKDDLAQTTRRWTIVFGHHPMYSNSLRGPQRAIRKAYAKIFTDHEADVVLTGHEHHYERLRVGNVNYIVSGGGGAQLTRFFGASSSLAKSSVHHFLHFAVTERSLVMRAIDIDGRTVDTMKLEDQAQQ